MAMNIIAPDQAIAVDAIITYIYADPGIGKSSLTHTADKPIVLDFDNGTKRIGEMRRGHVLQVAHWFDVTEINEQDLAPFNTIVVDTVGAMLDCIKTHLSKNKENLQRDKNLTLKAQGVASTLFAQHVLKWVSYGKDVVLIAHATEEEGGKEKIKIFRPDMAGKNRNTLYRMADIMGYMTSSHDAEGNIERVIYFKPGPSHHAKNSGNLGNERGEVLVPDLKHAPTFLADLINQAKAHMNTMTPEQIAEAKAQEDLNNYIQSCKEANHAGDLNQLTESLDKGHKYVRNMWHGVQIRAKEMGCNFDKEKGRWFNPKDFVGITDEQRDHIQDLLAEQEIDIKTFCEDMGIDCLLQIEAEKFQAVCDHIRNGATA